MGITAVVSSYYHWLGATLYGGYRKLWYRGPQTIKWYGANPTNCQSLARRAVVLLNGDPDDCTVFSSMLKAFEGKGFSCFTETFPYTTCEQLAEDVAGEALDFERLDGLLERIKTSFGSSDPIEVIIVGHSQGGITGARRIWNCDTPIPEEIEIKGLITLGSRLGGTRRTWFGTIPLYYKIMRRIDAFQTSFQNNRNKIGFVGTIGDFRDWIVPPSASLWSDQNLSVDFGGHTALPYSPQAINQIGEWIDQIWPSEST